MLVENSLNLCPSCPFSRNAAFKALLASINDLNSTLNMEVSCVGCRRAVKDLLQKLQNSGNDCNALMPLILMDNKMISLNKDHISNSQSLANLFSNQILRLRTTYIESMAGNFNPDLDSRTYIPICLACTYLAYLY